MEAKKENLELLDMMVQPVFCVKDGLIFRANAAARQLLFREGTPIEPLLEAGLEEYAAFEDGCLYLPLTQGMTASVRKISGMDLFEVDTGSDSAALRAMALAAGELRKPLSSALTNTAALLDSQEDPEALTQLSQLNRRLYQMLRLLGNMSDAEYMSDHCRMETVDAAAVFREIFEKAQVLVEQADITLTYEDLYEPIYCLADSAQLERAVLNILSNAVKFTPKGGTVTASLTRRGKQLRLSVSDSGSGIAQEVMGSLFQRYLRQPGLEDSRYGLGLGIRLIHAAAVHHGGTLLVTQGEDQGSRIVLTLAIRQKAQNQISSPVFRLDYTGGFDHSLVELADCLPAQLFDGSF